MVPPAAKTLDERVLLSIFIGFLHFLPHGLAVVPATLARRSDLPGVQPGRPILHGMEHWRATYTALFEILAKKENSRGTDLVQQAWRVRKDTCSIFTVLCSTNSVNSVI